MTHTFLTHRGRIPVDSLDMVRRMRLDACTSTPQFYIHFRDPEYYGQVDATLYYTEIGVRSESDVILYGGTMRYSQLVLIAQLIEETVKRTNDNALYAVLNSLVFPPKVLVGKNTISVVSNRLIGFNSYFSHIHKLGNDIVWGVILPLFGCK